MSAWLTAANGATLARAATIPAILVLLRVPGTEARIGAATLFVVASATDALDGYLARRQANASPLGAFLDLTVDKLLVAAVLIDLVGLQLVPAWIAIVIIAREIVVSGVRTFAAGRGSPIPAGPLGKVKTAVTGAAIPIAILALPGATAVLIGTAALTVISAFPYLVAGVRLAAVLPSTPAPTV